MSFSLVSAFRLGWAASYTFGMCHRAMWEKGFRAASDDRVRDLTKQWAVGLAERMRIEVKAYGMDDVDWSQPCVVMANHQSYLDVLALYRALPRPFGILAKKPLFSVPLFGGVMRALGCVAVDRGKRMDAFDVVQGAAAKVKGGSTIAVFPEGTRSRGDRIARFKKGPFYLAQMAQVPTVPIGIRGTAALMPRSNTGIRPGVIEVYAGRPILVESTAPAARVELMARVRSELSRLADLPATD